MNRRGTLAALATTSAMLLACTQAQAAHGRPETGPVRPSLTGLRVLLSNDDSMQMARPDASDGKGLYEVRRALCAAGADVVVMAPWANQSGAGTSATSGGRLTVERRTALPAGYANDCSGAPGGGAVYGVCKGAAPCGTSTPSATPADTVRLGINGGLAAKAGWKDGPDLVVTGSNFGPNVASVVNESGTLGAALAAIDEGVPAVALNSAYAPAVADSFEVADHTYRRTATFGAEFIVGLRERDLLASKYVINVNYPHRAERQRPRGTAWTSVGTQKIVGLHYTATGDTFTIGSRLCVAGSPDCRPETKHRADFTLLQQGYVTVTPVSPDRTHTGRATRGLERFVRDGR
ncbi:stationary phase survival protein SurE [Streptomyces longisporoflavus]|uniref:5'/3'-nucleotidase SurE n=1 Tax=Streptomyces longisporoflavus TaxID=28044 RepID=UPI00167DE8E8|nr:5'/3'-nucleotidase SurE [Streptomyces longisporoflavus]GGV27151.1 stationary phase survival protein SurE [Streptomyces longisporoflavus]